MFAGILRDTLQRSSRAHYKYRFGTDSDRIQARQPRWTAGTWRSLQALRLRRGVGEQRRTYRQRFSALKENNEHRAIFRDRRSSVRAKSKRCRLPLMKSAASSASPATSRKKEQFSAKRIIALARKGERDPAVLRDGVLREFAVSAWRGMSHSDGPHDRQAPPYLR